MPSRVPLPQRLRGASFRASDEEFHELGRGRLRGQGVQHPFHGACSVELDLSTVIGLCRSYEPMLGAGQYFSHTTAATLHGIPLPLVIVEASLVKAPPLHVATLVSRTPARTRGVIGHALTANDVDVAVVAGLPVIGAADTWCHLAAMLSRHDLVAAGVLITGKRMSAGGRQQPQCTIAELEIAVIRHRGRRGAAALSRALPRLRTGVDSRPETLLRLLLVGAGLPEPSVGLDVTVDDGMLTLHPDLAFERQQVVFEYEGDEHRTSKRRFRSDIERRELCASASPSRW